MESGKILVTGASGFVGGHVVSRLAGLGKPVLAACRTANLAFEAGVEVHDGLDLDSEIGWDKALQGVGTVVHCAARVHVFKEDGGDGLEAFRAINVKATLRLAQKAKAAGAKQFIFISSIGVNGSQSGEHAFRASDIPAPHSAYAISKLEAEQGLLELAHAQDGTGDMVVTLVRPPLVYGPNAPGNFSSLVKWIRRSLPMPLGMIDNRRSFVHVENLADFVACCIGCEPAFNRVMLVCDGQDVSTTGFVRKIAKAFDKKPMLLPVPKGMLERALRLAGKAGMAGQLCGDLQVDMTDECKAMNWRPPLSVDEALAKTALLWDRSAD